eukprot:CAMPEP_0198212504 /NCGR_PEP_ID=MMETSP1445-20131203/26411_1 /TAXON_ID=36898 /ORGANISM="Pyramimonas sp., Strain CCMP2087" /LENGTH=68 /DNA_ID=CAMNT_0043886963 /DNA_START=75 /DNA_END=281 /DNA_ORIENTATION=+
MSSAMLSSTFMTGKSSLEVTCWKPKATKLMTIRRPKKTNPSDKNKQRTVVYPLESNPVVAPPMFTVVE